MTGDDQRAHLAMLLQRFSVEMTATEDAVLGTDFLGNHEARMLVALHHTGPMTTAALTAHSNCSRGRTNRFVAVLVTRHFAERRASPADRRAVLLVPTADGRRAFARLERRLAGYYASAGPLAKDILHAIDDAYGPPPRVRRSPARDALGLLDEISSTGIAIDRAIRRRAGRRIVTGRQRLALVILAVDDTHPSALGERLALGSAGVTYLVDQLEARRFVRRTHDQHDRRAVTVSITREGRAAAAAVFAGIGDAHTELHSAFDQVRRFAKPA
jgi:DNA-binding MarR family transcriptional regulator